MTFLGPQSLGKNAKKKLFLQELIVLFELSSTVTKNYEIIWFISFFDSQIAMSILAILRAKSSDMITSA